MQCSFEFITVVYDSLKQMEVLLGFNERISICSSLLVQICHRDSDRKVN